jgi:hypothetical protein
VHLAHGFPSGFFSFSSQLFILNESTCQLIRPNLAKFYRDILTSRYQLDMGRKMNRTKLTLHLGALAISSLLAFSQNVHAAAIAIINGSSTTSEAGTTADITANLDTLLIAAGNTTTILDSVPGDLSPYAQVWDIRFSNTGALTAGQQLQYLSFLQGGGGIFMMGENLGFAARNSSVISLIAAAGGGALVFTTPSATQTVLAPFTDPNVIADGNVTYAAPGGVTSAGSGQFITVDESGNGTGLAFGVGELGLAPSGALTAMFDVNFMQGIFDQPDSQQLLQNLIAFVDDEVDVPEPATLGLFSLGVLGMTAVRRKRQDPVRAK